MARAQGIQYAMSGDAHIAYRLVGEGPPALMFLGGGTIPLEEFDEDPPTARMLRRLAALGGVVQLDQRGVGLSDPISLDDPPTSDDVVRDLVAVLDAAGADRLTVIGVFDDARPAIVLAARRPDRVRSLVLVNTSARVRQAPDYPIGVDDDFVAAFVAGVSPQPGEGAVDVLEFAAPARMDDERFRVWFERAGRRGASPATARVFAIGASNADLRPELPAITAPTLVLHGSGLTFPPAEHGQFLADNVADARFVVVPARGSLMSFDDPDPFLDEIEEFLTGALAGTEPDRELMTILFTDIVGSTALAADLGDRKWRELLDAHDSVVRQNVERFGGRAVKTTGDGILATFRSPTPTIRAATAIRAEARTLGLSLRAGIHSGEVDVRGNDIGGMAVNIAARIAASAAADEILVSRTVCDLLAGTNLDLVEHGVHELKGVPGTWELFALAPLS